MKRVSAGDDHSPGAVGIEEHTPLWRTRTSFVSLCVSPCIRIGRVLIIVYAVGELLHMVLIIVYHLLWF